MAKIGDQVRYLNAVGGGRIVRIDGQMAYVDEDGFETPVLLRECVVVASAEVAKSAPKIVTNDKEVKTPRLSSSGSEQAKTEPCNNPEGDRLNIVLAYEPRDLRHLSVSDFDVVLVNDSKYYLYYV